MISNYELRLGNSENCSVYVCMLKEVSFSLKTVGDVPELYKFSCFGISRYNSE